MSQKRLELAYNIPIVFEQMEGYKHKTDGVIFTAENAPYTLGTCNKMYNFYYQGLNGNQLTKIQLTLR